MPEISGDSFLRASILFNALMKSSGARGQGHHEPPLLLARPSTV